jgi:hypothetical protein
MRFYAEQIECVEAAFDYAATTPPAPPSYSGFAADPSFNSKYAVLWNQEVSALEAAVKSRMDSDLQKEITVLKNAGDSWTDGELRIPSVSSLCKRLTDAAQERITAAHGQVYVDEPCGIFHFIGNPVQVWGGGQRLNGCNADVPDAFGHGGHCMAKGDWDLTDQQWGYVLCFFGWNRASNDTSELSSSCEASIANDRRSLHYLCNSSPVSSPPVGAIGGHVEFILDYATLVHIPVNACWPTEKSVPDGTPGRNP